MGNCPKCLPPEIINYQLVCQCGRSTISKDLHQPCPACGDEMQIYDPSAEKSRHRRARSQEWEEGEMLRNPCDCPFCLAKFK